MGGTVVPEEYYTYVDYKSWNDGLRRELIDGDAFCMSPGPGTADEPDDDIDTVVQPDVMIVCDKSKIQRNGIKGAPDVVFEILSPSTARRDLDDKSRLYERVGVKEYVIADPQNQVVYAHRRDAEGRFSFRKVYGTDDVLEFGIFPDLKISLEPLWEDIQGLPAG